MEQGVLRSVRPMSAAESTHTPPTGPRWGMTIPFDRVPLHEQREWIVELADLGYTDVWSSEANGADAFTPLALASAWAPSCPAGWPRRVAAMR